MVAMFGLLRALRDEVYDRLDIWLNEMSWTLADA